MKILWVTFILPNPQALSGAAFPMCAQLEGLGGRHEISMVTFAPATPAEKRVLDNLRGSGIQVHVLGESLPRPLILFKRQAASILARLSGSKPWEVLATPNPRMQELLDQFLARQGFDVIQVENIGITGYRYETRTPSILAEHEVGRSWQPAQVEIWRQFDRIQVFTARDAAKIQSLAPELAHRIRINPFGVDIPPETDTCREEPGQIVFVGGFDHLPNVDAALWLGNEIMPLLLQRRPEARLSIVGSSPPRAVRALECREITVTGRVPAIRPYLERAAVVVAPLRTGGGMRVKVLQAMAMGKPVVTTPLGAEGIIGIPGGLPLKIAESAAEIAAATASLLASSGHRRDLGSRARALVAEQHSCSAYGCRLEKIYAELQTQRGSRKPT